ncbi:MAG: hypothetical protein EBS19_12685, partial [Spirochaetia bacterium]|nr:hypothetical protein [Spirochaetia bacterium]
MGSVNKIVKKSPNFIKWSYYNLVPFHKRYGKVYKETLDFLLYTSEWNEEERKFFEKKLGLKEDELNVYAQADALKWPAQIANQVRIKKDGIKFNMASPIDYIKYRLTALSPKVALTHSEAKERLAETEYVFVNIEEKALDENKTLTVKMQAYDKVKSIIENPKKKEALYKVLFDQPVPTK